LRNTPIRAVVCCGVLDGDLLDTLGRVEGERERGGRSFVQEIAKSKRKESAEVTKLKPLEGSR
jgi:hypothetical protein